MNDIGHKEKLIEMYEKSFDISDIKNVSAKEKLHLENIVQNIESNKGVFTVLVTLMIHKILNKRQDVRRHQYGMKDGFSGRSVDTNYITPTLNKLGLSAMRETGWLTRSLEQPYPYDLKYKGMIQGKELKESFLRIIDAFQKNPKLTESFLRLILHGAIKLKDSRKVKIKKINNQEKISIRKTVTVLEKHFTKKYKTSGGSKLPALAFYAIYKILVQEIDRYKNCKVKKIGSHTASDKTSGTAGDIEITKNNSIYEVLEIKLDKPIDSTVIIGIYEKIQRFNPKRYYVLSYIGISEKDQDYIEEMVEKIKNEHGCQLIVNGLLQTLKYYLRLISSTEKFLNQYSKLVSDDKEIKTIHKKELNQILKEEKILKEEE